MPIDRETLRQLSHMVRPLATRIANTIVRGVLQLADDSLKQQLLQLGALAEETIDGAENFQPYGLSAVPLAGAEHVTVFPGGDRSHPLTIAVSDRRYRPTGGQPGEVIVHNHVTGCRVTMKANGDVVVQAAAGRKVLIGSASASTPPALSSELADLKSRVAAWTPVAGDGGASLKTVIAAWPVPGATKVDVE